MTPAEVQDVWWPDRVTQWLKASATFAEFKKKRTFTFVHMFSGKEDMLADAIARLANLEGMSVHIYSFGKEGCTRCESNEVDFLKDQPYLDLVEQCREPGVHLWPPWQLSSPASRS